MTMDQINMVAFGMSAVGLVWVVVQLAMIPPAPNAVAAEDIFRCYLGKVACCHFSLVSAMIRLFCIWLLELHTKFDYGVSENCYFLLRSSLL